VPAAAPARPDPFSIEDIEAEFARLLGRPLDRKDNKG
jgi:flagellar protein FliO/FliZ